MATYRVTAPNGRTYRVDGPAGADQSAVIAEVLRQYPEARETAPPPERTWREAGTDIGASLTKGVGNLVQLPGQVYGLATGDFSDTGMLGAGKRLEELGQSQKSEALQARERQRDERVAQVEADEGQWAAFKATLSETVKDPALVSSFLAEMAPQLAPIIASGGVGAAVAAGRTTARQLAAGATKEVAAKAAQAAAMKVGTTAAIQTGAVMQGADVGAGTYDAIFNTVLEQGGSPEQAAEAALNRARAAGVAGYGLSVIANRYLPGGQALERAIVGKGSGAGRVAGAAMGALKEVPSENVEELGGAFARNVALKTVDPEQSLTQGLGQTAAMSTIGAVGLGGAVGAYGGRSPGAQPAAATPPADENLEQDAQDTPDGDLPPEAPVPDDVLARRLTQLKDDTTPEGVQLRQSIERLQAERQRGTAATAAAVPLPETYGELAQRREQLAQQRATPETKRTIKMIEEKMREITTQGVLEAREQSGREQKLAQQSAFAQAEPDLFGMTYPPAEEPAPARRASDQTPDFALTPPEPVEFEQQALDLETPEADYLPPSQAIAQRVPYVQMPLAPNKPAPRTRTQMPAAPAQPETTNETRTAEPDGGPVPATPTGDVESRVGTPRRGRTQPGNTGPVDVVTPDDARVDGVQPKPAVPAARTKPAADPLMQEPPAPQVLQRLESVTSQQELASGMDDVVAVQQDPNHPEHDQVANFVARNAREPAFMRALEQAEERARQKRKAAAPAPAAQADPTEDLDPMEGDELAQLANAVDRRTNAKGLSAALRKHARYRPGDGNAERPTQPIQDRALRRSIERVTRELGVPADIVTVLDSVRDIDPSQRAGSRSGAVIDNKLYLFRDGINDDASGRQTVLHELLHLGLRKLLPPAEYRMTMARLYNQNPDVRALADKWLASDIGKEKIAELRKTTPAVHLEAESRAVAVDEVLAEMAEARKSPGMVRALGNWFANIAARLGMTDLARTIRTMGMTELEAFVDTALRAAGDANKEAANVGDRNRSPEQDAAFKRWFAGSKVVDAEGKPLVVYHGTRGEFSTFDAARNPRGERGFYFTNNASLASSYAGADGSVLPVYVALPNAKVYEYDDRTLTDGMWQGVADIDPQTWWDEMWSQKQLRVGPEGAVVKNTNTGDVLVVAYAPEQIKSAIGNNGAYDSRNPDIRFRTAPQQPANPNTTRADIERTLQALAMEPVVEPTRTQRVLETVNDAVENPTATAAELKSRATGFMDMVGNKIFSTNFAMNAALRRSIPAEAQERLGWLLKTSDAQPDASSVVAGVFSRMGNIKYEADTYKWRGEEGKTSMEDLARTVSNITQRYNLDPAQADRVFHSFFIARRALVLDQRNESLRSDASILSAAGHKAQAADLRKRVVTNLPDADWVVQALELAEAIPELNDAVQQWNEVRATTVDLVVQSGLWNRAMAEDMLDAAEWVPYYRTEQLLASKGPKEFISGLTSRAADIRGKRLKGSEAEINDVFDNMMRWVQHAVERSVRNHMANQRMDAAVEFGLAEPVDLDSTPGTAPNKITVFRDGLPHAYNMADPLFMDSFQGLEAVALPILKGWAKFTNVLRQSVVLNPLFGVLQVPQDAIAAIYTSGLKPQYAFTIPARAVKEFLQTLFMPERSAAHLELRRYGAVGARDTTADVVRSDLEFMEGARKDISMPARAWRQVSQVLNHIAMASDASVRQATYNAALDAGLSKAEAVEKAFQMINFRNRGTSKTLAVASRLIPFFNAYLAAQHVAYKTISGQGTSPTDQKAALQTLAATTIGMMGLATLYAMLNGGDEGYEKRPLYVRDRVFVIPGTDGLSIPMRADIFAFPKVFAEHMWHHFTEDGTIDGANTRRSMRDLLLTSLLSPTVVPQMIKPAAEVALNYNLFRQRPLVSQGLAKAETEVQFTDASSSLGRLVGESGVMSAISFDHLMRGYLGSLGGLVLYTTNDMLGAAMGTPRPSMPMWDAVATFPGASTLLPKQNDSALRQDFYELKDAIDTVTSTVSRLNGVDPQALDEYLNNEAKMTRLGLSTGVNKAYRQMMDIRKAISMVRSDRTMTAAEKATQIDELYQMESEVLQSLDIRKLREMAQL